MKTDFAYKGMMVPVFTPFNDDKKKSINYEMIDKYAQYLKKMGMNGVMVNGMTGEGMTLTVDERKQLTEKWLEATRKYDMKMIVNIGGTNLPSVYELAEHAEKVKVDAIMVLPDLYYSPKNEGDLVAYIKDVVAYAPTRPLFYYHIPMMTNVYISMYYFMELVTKEVPTYAGIFYAGDNIDQIAYVKEKMPSYTYIVAMGTSLLAYMAEGFEAYSMTAMNLYPESIKEVYDYMIGYKLNEAYVATKKMSKLVYDMYNINLDLDYVTVMKAEMNKLYPAMKMGPTRKPKTTKNLSLYMGKM